MIHHKNYLFMLVFIFSSLVTPIGAQARMTDPFGFTDNFATLDKTRWRVSHGWSNGDHQSCEWRDSAATIENNKLLLTISDRGGKVRPLGCPEIQSDAVLSYGRYETRMRAAAGSGLVTAFFTYIGPPHGVPEWDEIDIEILGKDPTKAEMNYVVNGKGIKGKIVDLGFDSSKEFHDYAFEWTKTSITWYVDGKEVYKTPVGAPMPRNPQRAMFSLWSGTSPQQDDWQGRFDYTQPITAEVISTKFTPYN